MTQPDNTIDSEYGNTVNGVLYELIDSLTTDTQARIKGRQLIDKAIAQEATKARLDEVSLAISNTITTPGTIDEHLKARFEKLNLTADKEEA